MIAALTFAVAVAAVPVPPPAAMTVPLVSVRAGQPPAYARIVTAGCRQDNQRRVAIDRATFERMVFGTHAKRIVFYVSGFATAVPLEAATAERIARVLGPADKVVIVDWGSAGKRGPAAYEGDERTARRNAPAFAAELRTLHSAAKGREFDIFAHSLGTRVVAMAIAKLGVTDGRIVTRAALAAPDMTIADYQRAIERLPGPVGRVTIYSSHRDRALMISEVLNLHRRLGLITHWRRALANTDVVDASVASEGSVGHGYAINEPVMIADVGATLADAPVPHADWRTRREGPTTTWVFVPPPGAGNPAVAAASVCAVP